MAIITTERLVISEFTLEDVDFIIELLNSPGWLQYIGDRGVKTVDDAIAYLTNGPMKSYAEQGLGLWRVSLRDDGTHIGMCGLLQRAYLAHMDIGFAQLPRYGRMGYAYEAADAVLHYAAETLALPVVAAIVTPGNAASVRLLGKLGFVEKGLMAIPGSDDDEVLLLEAVTERGR
jgi:RimJ/RimL family protein N-acetyltransferase